MASLQEFLDVIDAAKTKVLELQDVIANGGMTPQEEAQALEQLKLLSQLADPNQPNP